MSSISRSACSDSRTSNFIAPRAFSETAGGSNPGVEEPGARAGLSLHALADRGEGFADGPDFARVDILVGECEQLQQGQGFLAFLVARDILHDGLGLAVHGDD